MPTPGTNLQYGNASFISEMMVRKLGLHQKSIIFAQSTKTRNGAADPGTTFPRMIALCVKYSTTTAPTSNASGDQPTGVGDLCVYVAAENVGGYKVPVASISIYRCTAYTNTTTFTWAQIA